MKSVVLSNGCRTQYQFGLSSFEVMKQGGSRAGCVSLVSSLTFDVYLLQSSEMGDVFRKIKDAPDKDAAELFTTKILPGSVGLAFLLR